jgi:beta-mannosidase
MADDRKDKEYGNRLIKDYMSWQFKDPKDFESYVYVSQVLQAEGMKTAIEAHRKNMPFCMGSLYWQIDDCWPVASWSSIDYYGNWKAGHYWARSAYENIHIIPDINKDSLEVFIVSDKLADSPLSLEISAENFNGKKLFDETTKVNVSANSGNLYYRAENSKLLNGGNEDNTVVICRLKKDGEIISQNLFYFNSPKDLNLEKVKITPVIKKVNDGYNITVSAPVLAKSVYLSLEDGESFFSDNYFDLLPGESKTIHLKSSAKPGQIEKSLKIISLSDSY